MTEARGTHYLVGGGIASLAAAVFLIRDAGVAGAEIQVLEEGHCLGGSLDGALLSDGSYLVRGGRMLERHFLCTSDLLASIGSLEGGHSLQQEIERFNCEAPSSSRCRLVRDGRRVEAPRLGLRRRDLLDLAWLLLRPERTLAGRTIDSCFTPGFFETDFWTMWSTTFAFQSWHSAAELRRYFRRFVHLFPGFVRLEGILRTRYNQYESLIVPIVDWLVAHGVRFALGTQVVDVEVERQGAVLRARALLLLQEGREERRPLAAADRLYLTLGSITADSTLGSNSLPPPEPTAESGAWRLWQRLAARDPAFGRPDAFCAERSRTGWESFTVTLRSSAFFDFMEAFTGNAAGTGGLVTFADSGWKMSIVLFRQPHFRHQPEQVFVFWGYGLRADRQGDFVAKAMTDCSGDEILLELAGHLRLGAQAMTLLRDASVIPCMMPHITSQFMPRRPGDRPKVVPEGALNVAVLGQFCEMPRDTVFTVEYSVRSAMSAVHALTGSGRPPPPVRRTDRDPRVLWRALRTLVRN